MAAHAYVVGGAIDSPFFLVALPWVMVAIWAFQGNLRAIPSMAWVMLLILTASMVYLVIETPPTRDAAPVISLTIVPSIISWLGLILYLRHLRREELIWRSIEAEYEPDNSGWTGNADRLSSDVQSFVSDDSGAVWSGRDREDAIGVDARDERSGGAVKPRPAIAEPLQEAA
jgi:hypothetical protein